MYTTELQKSAKPAVEHIEDPDKLAAFEARVAADEFIEPKDWMPEAYRRPRDPIALRQHADDLAVRVLRDLPGERAPIGLGHPVLGLDELVGRHARLERGELVRILDAFDGLRLLKLGRIHGRLPTVRRPIGQRIRRGSDMLQTREPPVGRPPLSL